MSHGTIGRSTTAPASVLAEGVATSLEIDRSEDRIFWTEHLSPERAKLVEDFKAELVRRGVLNTLESSHSTLCRFLQARKWVMADAILMYENMSKFRKENGADTILESFTFPEQRQVFDTYPMFYHGCDRFGRPVYIEVLRDVDVSKLFKITTKERFFKSHIQGWERLKRVRLPACNRMTEKDVFTTLCVIDCKGIGLRQFSSQSRELMKALATLDQDNYPEHLGELFIINAPSWFAMVWSFASAFVDDRTRSKIHVITKKQLPLLFDMVDEATFPEFLGGKCQCAGGCLYSDLGPWNHASGYEGQWLKRYRPCSHPNPGAAAAHAKAQPGPAAAGPSVVAPAAPAAAPRGSGGHGVSGSGAANGNGALREGRSSPGGASPATTTYGSPLGSLDEDELRMLAHLKLEAEAGGAAGLSLVTPSVGRMETAGTMRLVLGEEHGRVVMKSTSCRDMGGADLGLGLGNGNGVGH